LRKAAGWGFAFGVILLMSRCGSDVPPISILPNATPTAQTTSALPSRLTCVSLAGFYRVDNLDTSLSGVISPYRSFGDLTQLSDPYLFSTSATPDAIAVDATHNEIFVANSATHSITVYQRTSFGTGNISPLRVLQGGSTGLNVPNGIAINTTTNELIVSNWGNNSVTFYARNASGNTAPTRTLTGSNTTLTTPMGIAFESTSNTLWVANNTGGTGSITVYSYPAITITGNMNTAPTGTITAGINGPVGIAIDNTTAPGYAWVANNGNSKVTLYKLTDESLAFTKSPGFAPVGITVDTTHSQFTLSSGTTPITSRLSTYPLAYDNTSVLAFSLAAELSTPTGVAVDMTNSELLAINTGSGTLSVGVYSQAETTDGTLHGTKPLRNISSLFTSLYSPSAIAVDSANQRIAVASVLAGSDSVSIYPLSATGNLYTQITFSGGNTQLDKPVALALDSNFLYVANNGTGASTGLITVYPLSTGGGNVAPTSTISTVAKGINKPTGIALDPNLSNGTSYIYVANAGAGAGSNAITSYPVFTGAYAGAAPAAITLNVSVPGGIYVDSSATAASNHQEVFITNGNNSISVYDISSAGYGTSLRMIKGSSTLLNNPLGLYVDATHDEIVTANAGGNSVLIFSRTGGGTVAASENIAPLRTLTEVNTGLYYPTGVAKCQ
jgi:6-phosphogluconolactonase (cycloisomerase 2 family)